MLSTRGIILRVVKYGETSIICDVFTEAVGLKSYIINGVRKKNAKYPASLFQPMYLVEMVVYDSPKNKLNRIKEIKSEYVYHSIPFDITKSSIGQFALEVFRKSIKEQETNAELFDFVRKFFLFLDTIEKDYANCHLWFMVHLCHYLGFTPNGICSEDTPYLDIENGKFVAKRIGNLQMNQFSSAEIFTLMHLELQDAYQLKLNHQSRNILIEDMIRFYQYHIDGLQSINAHLVLARVFS